MYSLGWMHIAEHVTSINFPKSSPNMLNNVEIRSLKESPMEIRASLFGRREFFRCEEYSLKDLSFQGKLLSLVVCFFCAQNGFVFVFIFTFCCWLFWSPVFSNFSGPNLSNFHRQRWASCDKRKWKQQQKLLSSAQKNVQFGVAEPGLPCGWISIWWNIPYFLAP